MTTLIDREALQAKLRAATGKGVRMAMLDTGVDESHPELSGKIAQSYELVRGRGGSYACEPRSGADEMDHGTACAGIILGLAPDVELHSVKVMGGNARGSSDELVAGLAWAVEQRMDVVNISAGTMDRGSRSKLADVTDKAFYNGVIVVAAAHNQGMTAYPANLSSVLSVDYEFIEDALTFRYRLGLPIELEANGVYVKAPSSGGGTREFLGTSFACPHVSAVVARLVEIYPDLQPFEARSLLWHMRLLETNGESE